MTSPAGRERGLAAAEARVAEHAARIERLRPYYRHLRGETDVATLLARAADLAVRDFGFARAVVVTAGMSMLTTAGSVALARPESDTLRRRLQAAPVLLPADSLEDRLVRGLSAADGSRVSVLAGALELDAFAIAPIAPDATALALLVVDRPGPPIDALDRILVASLATTISVALEHAVLSARMAEVSNELRHLTSSAQALMDEALHAPVTIPTVRGHASAFPHPGLTATTAHGDRHEELTAREREVAALLVEGRTNREIAEHLIVSVETVKDCVVRVRRKLRAANRVEAAARYLQLSQRP